MTTPKRVLIVEDQFLLSEFLTIWIEAFGHTVVGVATDCDSAIEQALALRPDLILMDVQLDGALTGIDAGQAIRATFDPRIVYVTGTNDVDELKRLGATAPELLPKPVATDALRRLLES